MRAKGWFCDCSGAVCGGISLFLLSEVLTMGEKLNLYGFNNLTKSLSFKH